MKWKKIAALAVSAATLCMATACGQGANAGMEPNVSEMRSICNLAVMECYYHNVAKFKKEGNRILFFGDKDKHFWIEYSGVVRFGINAAYVNIEADDTNLTITIPAAEVQSCKVDSSSLNSDSYIVAIGSGDITAEDEIVAFEEAQTVLEEQARNDETLLMQAQQRAQTLLENYVTNLGNVVGKQYTIDWVYLDAEGNPLGEKTSSETETIAASESD